MKRLESSAKTPEFTEQFEQLYAQYADDVLRMAYFYLADKQKAEDVCQDVFIKLYTRGENIAPGRKSVAAPRDGQLLPRPLAQRVAQARRAWRAES